ncbi:MAG: GntR family transcriptional regulator [Actinomycetes bacterium]
MSVTGGQGLAREAVAPGSRFVQRPAPLRESVYEALAEMIISRSLEPGQHLVELELAEVLGVSRQPVREALQRLHTEGWVDLKPGYGAFVHIPTEDEADQLLAARAVLESESARLAAGRVTEESLATLWKLCQDGLDALDPPDIEAFVRANSAFHAYVTELSGNRVLADFASQVDRRVRWYYTPVASQRGHEACKEHAALIEAIADRDAERAAEMMRTHTERTRQAYHSSRADSGEAYPELTEHKRRSRRRDP